MKIVNAIFLLLFITGTSFAQITWDKKTGPYGGRITDINYHASTGKFFAIGGMTYTPYVSTNGLTWTKLNFTGMPTNQRPVEFFIDESNNDIYLIFLDGDLYKSTDGGSTFALVNPSSKYISGTKMTKSSDGLFIIGSTNTGISVVWRSINNGVTWTQGYTAASGEKFKDIMVNDQNQLFLYTFASDASVYRSDNGGVAFTKKMSGIPGGDQVNSLVKSPNGASLFALTQNGIYRTINDGDTWTVVTGTGLVTPGSNYGMLFCPSNTLLYFINNNIEDIYSIALTGAVPAPSGTWSTSSSSAPKDILCVTPVSATNFYLGQSDNGISRTTSCCASFAEVSDGIEELRVYDMLVAGSSGNLLVTSASGLHFSTDGASWSKPNIGTTPLFNGRVLRNTSSGELYLYGTGNGFAQKSSNNGSTWGVHTALPDNSIFFLETIDGIKLYGMSSTKIHYSNNSGTAWQTGAGLTITGALPASFQLYDFDVDANFNLYARIYNSTANRDEILKITLSPSPGTGTPTTAVATRIDGNSGYTIGSLESRGFEANGSIIYAMGRNVANTKYVVNSSSNAGATWTSVDAVGGFNLNVGFNGYIFITKSNSFPDSFTTSISRNGGATFTGLDAIPSANFADYKETFLADDGYAYSLMEYNTLYKTSDIVITPAAPTGTTVVSKSNTSATLRWNDNSNIDDRYEIRKFNGSSYDSIGTIDVNTETSPQHYGYFELINLLPGTAYQYQIIAENEAGESTGDIVNFTTLSTTCGTIPDNRSWTGLMANQSGLGSPTGLNIQIKKISGNLYSISDVTAGVLNALTSNLTIAAQFYENCTETSIDFSSGSNIRPNGNGTWNSGTNTLTLKWRTRPSVADEFDQITLTLNANDPTPVAPGNVTAYNYAANTMEVSWTASGFEKTFLIERRLASGTYSQVGTVPYPNLNFIDNTAGISLGQTYEYRVRSQNGNASPGTSPYSVEASILHKKPNFTVSQTTVTSTTANSLGYLWADFNSDGFDDLVLTQFDLFSGSKSTPLFFQNNTAGNFTAVDPGFAVGSFGSGTAADYDNDGDLDLFYTLFGEPNRLYRNNGGFSFSLVDPSAVSEQGGAGIDGIQFASSWVDFDKDGLLDLFTPRAGDPTTSFLFKQNPDHTFTKSTTAGDLITALMEAFAMAWADYDNDGDQDVFIVDEDSGEPNKLFKNNGNGTFTRVSPTAFDTDINPGSQTAAWGDYDNDQDPDLFVGYESGANFLFKNNGNGTFTKLPASGGTNFSGPDECIGSAWLDANNDGFLDLFITSATGNWLFMNSNGTSFTAVSNEKINDTNFNALAVAASDYNNDGFVDVAVSRTTLNSGQPGVAKSSLLFTNINSTGNWLKIKLIGTVSNKSAIGARVRVNIGVQNQIREVTAHVGVGSQHSLTQHFGLGAATKADNVVVTWPSGKVQTFTNVSANSTFTAVEDATGPTATTLTPANNATGVASNTQISITLNENSTAVAGKFLLVYLHSDLTNALTGVNLSASVKNGNTYTFTVPVTLLVGTQYNVSVDAGAFLDDFGNPSLEFPTGLWTFTTAPAVDAIAPVITLGPEVAPAVGFGTRPKQVTVTDNVGVTSVIVSIRKISGSTFAEVPAVQGTDLTKWNIALSETNHFDATGTELFITATDAAGNTTRSPLTGTHKIYLTYEGDQAATIDSDHIGFGGTKASWKVFSIPFELGSNNAVTTIFDEVTGNAALQTKVDYSLLTIQNGGTDWTVYPNFSTINRGQGYFINIKTATTIKIPNATAPTNSRDNLFKINLAQGWNMVGNPYLTSISWANVATLNGLTGGSAEILKYNGTSYATGVQTLEAWEGAFVFSAAAVSDVDIPFLGQTASGGRKGYKGLGSDINADEWMVKLNLTQGEQSYELGAIGMAPDASTSYDEYDAVTPPRFFDYLEMNFAHPEFFAKRFTRDVVPTQNAYTWEFSVDATLATETTLNWDNSAFSMAAKDIFLLDVTRQVLVSMKETSSYSFNPKESANFRVFFGEDLRIAPERVQLGKAYPNPTSGLTTVAFSLPESDGLNQLVTMDIVDATGRPIGILKQGYFNPGYHEVAFDAKELTIGFYLYRLSVQGQKGKTSQINKLIIK